MYSLTIHQPVPADLFTSGPFFSIREKECHLWHFPLCCEKNILERMEQLLSPREKIRRNSFIFSRDRDNFTLSHGSLRLILSKYLMIEPRDIEFSFSCHGKPALRNRQIFFNMSHCVDAVLIGLSPEFEIGVDIEKIENHIAWKDLSGLVFTSQELSRIRSINREEGKKAFFFQTWTMKEAFLKAKGKGLSDSMTEIEPQDTFSDPGSWISIKDSSGIICSGKNLILDRDHAASIVIRPV